MAVQIGSDSDELVESHEINVTPFIDVILVLLIIFMVAAPLATVDVPVDLPSSTSEPQPRPDKPVFVTLKTNHSLTVGNDAVSLDAVAAALDSASGGNKDQRVFVRADHDVNYGEVMGLMNALRNAGYLKVGLVALEAKEGL
jgi:biopolymer transport protein ExbD